MKAATFLALALGPVPRSVPRSRCDFCGDDKGLIRTVEVGGLRVRTHKRCIEAAQEGEQR